MYSEDSASVSACCMKVEEADCGEFTPAGFNQALSLRFLSISMYPQFHLLFVPIWRKSPTTLKLSAKGRIPKKAEEFHNHTRL